MRLCLPAFIYVYTFPFLHLSRIADAAAVRPDAGRAGESQSPRGAVNGLQGRDDGKLPGSATSGVSAGARDVRQNLGPPVE